MSRKGCGMSQSGMKSSHFDAEYDALPESVKARYSKTEYLWMGEWRRAGLVDEETLPEVPED